MWGLNFFLQQTPPLTQFHLKLNCTAKNKRNGGSKMSQNGSTKENRPSSCPQSKVQTEYEDTEVITSFSRSRSFSTHEEKQKSSPRKVQYKKPFWIPNTHFKMDNYNWKAQQYMPSKTSFFWASKRKSYVSGSFRADEDSRDFTTAWNVMATSSRKQMSITRFTFKHGFCYNA